MDDGTETLLTSAGVVAAWFLFSYAIGEWIGDYYYLIETVCLLLIFGLLYQVWTSSPDDFDFLDIFIEIGDEFNRTGAQVALILVVTSLVVTSIFLRNAVERTLGGVAVVQLLAFIGIISRMFVNVRLTGDPREIFDGERDTYLIYGAGLLAVFISFWIRGMYPPYTTMHNAVVIFLSTFIPAGVLYIVLEGRDLPSLKDLTGEVP